MVALLSRCRAAAALFVEIPPDTDLSEAAFLYAAQAQLARRALVVPFEALERLAAGVALPERIVFVFNIARCGSTLVNAMLNRVGGVWSLSEPDAFFDMVMRRHLLDPAEIPGLIRACLRLHFRPPPGREVHTLAIKLRSESLFQAEQFHAAFPGARYVFLYRDGVGWARSLWYFGQNLGFPLVLSGEVLRFDWWMMSVAAPFELLEPWLDPDGSIPLERELALSWAMRVEEYLRLRALGLPFLALRYSELRADPEASAVRMLRHCGLPIEASAAAAGAFVRDSQAGTVIARDRRDGLPFTEAAVAEFRATLARQPWITSPDLMLPDIYRGASGRTG